MRIMGIDPGLSGALALIDTRTGEQVTTDMPLRELSRKVVKKRGKKPREKIKRVVDGGAVADWVERNRPDIAVTEKVASRPEQGVVSVFTFGEAYGAVCGAVQAMNVPLEYVMPAVWKRRVGLIGKDKKASLVLARKLFKRASKDLKRVKDNGRAEALLIAKWRELAQGSL